MEVEVISSKKELRRFLNEDARALGISYRFPVITTSNSMVWLTDPIWKWTKLLRHLEYWENCHQGILSFPYRLMLRHRFVKLSTFLGISIPINTCGPGLAILHYGSIVISRHAKIGSNVTINSCVNIGYHRGGPIIGDNVYIGPGAKLFGPISIANNCKIGANAVVCNSCYSEGAVLLGIPASSRA